MSINKVVLLGNVGKDPVVRYFEKGAAKASFPLATSESYTNQQGETVTSTEWHNIVLWRELALIAEKTVVKGTQLCITGKIKTRSYVDKEGSNKYITEILADTMFVFDKKNAAPGSLDYTAARPANQVKSEPKPGISEPESSYQPGSVSSDAGKKDTPAGSAFDNENLSGDDDLPF